MYLNKTSRLYSIYYLSLFLVFFVFFSQVHPLVPFDTDDWMYMGLARPPYPTIYQWNPTKLLPELIQPLLGLFAAYFVSPILGDYIDALVVTHASVISLFITTYFFFIQKVLTRKFWLSPITGFCIITILVLLHFLVLKTRSLGNDHLFFSEDVNCYYNYIVPNLLCACLVMWLICNDIHAIKNYKTIGVIYFLTFIALFSNLYSSVVLVAYVGAVLLFNLCSCNKKQSGWLIKFITHNRFFLAAVLVWLVVQLFESNGVRATAYGYMELPFGESLLLTLQYIYYRLHINGWFILFTFAVIVMGKGYHFFKENRQLFHIGRFQGIILLAMILSFLYLTLLSSRVFPFYMIKSDVMLSYLFFFFLLVALCLGYLTIKLPFVKVLFPFVISFFFFTLNLTENTFKDVQFFHGTDIQTCKKIDNEMINQVKTAELLGKDTVTIFVHNYNEFTNWPMKMDDGQYVGITLYKHGIIKRKIVTVFERMPGEPDTTE